MRCCREGCAGLRLRDGCECGDGEEGREEDEWDWDWEKPWDCEPHYPGLDLVDEKGE